MKTSLLLAAALAASSASGHSQTFVTQTLAFDGVPNYTDALVFDKYTGLASDIISIQISYSLTVAGGIFIFDNDALTPANGVIAEFGTSLGVTSTDVSLLNGSFQPVISNAKSTNSGTFNLAANQGDGPSDFSPDGPDGAQLSGTVVTTTGSGNIGSVLFGQYAGGGTFTINATASQLASLSFNSGIETATTPQNASGFVTVRYEVIPEPSSALLIGLGVLGLAFRRRRA